MEDKAGRKYLRLDEAQEGQCVTLDEDFTCHVGDEVTLLKDHLGIYFQCDEGHHYITGQADDDIHCVGIYPK